MTDTYSAEKRSAVMRRVKGKDTTPELTVRRALTRLGVRYRLHRADLPGKPDIVMPGRRLALFVHGCFWHGHDCARGARVPKQNREYWVGKVGRNRDRDARHREAMAMAGWRVETIWECELKDAAALETQLRGFLDGYDRKRASKAPPPCGEGLGWGCEPPGSELTPPHPTLSPQGGEGFVSSE